MEGSEGSSGRERYVVATASGPGLRADASSHQLAGRLPPLLLSHRVLSLLGPSNLKTGKQKLGPETAAPRRKEGAARGVGVVVRCVDELLSQCLVIVDGKGPFLWCAGGGRLICFGNPYVRLQELARVCGLLEEEGELSRE